MFASFSSKRNFMSFIMYRSRVPAVCRAATILVPAVFAGWNRGPDAKTDTRICLCGALCVYLSPDCGAAGKYPERRCRYPELTADAAARGKKDRIT